MDLFHTLQLCLQDGFLEGFLPRQVPAYIALWGIATFSCKGSINLHECKCRSAWEHLFPIVSPRIHGCILIFIRGKMVYRYCFKLHFSTMNEFGHRLHAWGLYVCELLIHVFPPFFSLLPRVGNGTRWQGGGWGDWGLQCFPDFHLSFTLPPKSNKQRCESSPKWNNPHQQWTKPRCTWIVHLPCRVWGRN